LYFTGRNKVSRIWIVAGRLERTRERECEAKNKSRKHSGKKEGSWGDLQDSKTRMEYLVLREYSNIEEGNILLEERRIKLRKS